MASQSFTMSISLDDAGKGMLDVTFDPPLNAKMVERGYLQCVIVDAASKALKCVQHYVSPDDAGGEGATDCDDDE